MEKQSYISHCSLPEGAPLWPGLHQTSWGKPPLLRMCKRCLHLSLETHSCFLPFTGGFPSCFCSKQWTPQGPMHVGPEQSFFLSESSPYITQGGAFQIGVSRHDSGGLWVLPKGLNIVFSSGVIWMNTPEPVLLPNFKTCLSIWIKVTFMANESVCSITEGKYFTWVQTEKDGKRIVWSYETMGFSALTSFPSNLGQYALTVSVV